MTPEPMTAEQIAEIRKRGPVGYHCDHSDEPYDARTHHEWEYVEGEGHVFQHMPDVVSAHRGPREYLSLEQQAQRCPRALPVYDADVPALLAEVERLTIEASEGRNVIEAVRSVTGGGRLPSEWSKTWRARAEKAEAALAEANETLAELAFAEDHGDEDRLRTERNEWMTRAEKVEAALSSVWSEVERWDQSHVSSSSMRQIVRDLFAIRDRAESSSPTEEKG